MSDLFVYLVKVNIALIIFCLGYYAVLRHLTFYALNRVYLVCAIVFATLYPFVDFAAFINTHEQIARPIQIVIINWQAPVADIVQHDKWYWFAMIFWAGVIVLAIKFIMQLLSLYKLHRQSKPIQIHQYLVRVISGNINPFSFWKNIYVNPENHQPHELKAILAHEQVHVNEWHTLDILLGELSTIFYWFNPGVWLMKRAIRENIEFITDQKILQSGSDPKAYQYSLLNVTFNGGHNAIVNHFNTSTIKKRIIMMNSKRSSPINLTRYAVLVPAVVILILVFSASKAELSKQVAKGNAAIVKAINNTINNLALPNGNTVTIAAKRTFMALPNAVSAFLTDEQPKSNLRDSLIINGQHNLTIPFSLFAADDTSKNKKNKEIVVVGYGKPTRDTIEVNNTVEALLKQLPGAYINPDGMLTINQQVVTSVKINGVEMKSTNNLPTKNVLVDKMKGITISPGGEVIVTGRPVTQAEINKGIYYGGDSINYTTSRLNGGAITIRGNAKTTATQPLIIVNGKPADGTTYLNQDDIQSMTVYKGATAANMYGERAKDGAILITTNNLQVKPVQGYSGLTYTTKDPVYIVNGFRLSKDSINHIPASQISKINVIKDGADAAKYDDKGKKSVIEITTKSPGAGIINGNVFTTTREPNVFNFNTKNIFSGKLLLLNGKETTESELNKIPADKIKLIKPLTQKEKARYGDKAKNGGFSITTIK